MEFSHVTVSVTGSLCFLLWLKLALHTHTVVAEHNADVPKADDQKDYHTRPANFQTDEINEQLRAGRVVKRIMSQPDPCIPFAEAGDHLEVLYTGYFTDGTVFDSSHGRRATPFILGEGQVIQGWEEGMSGMCVGESRRLLIPSDMAYGDAGYPPVIPPKATLLFEVTLAKLEKAGGSGSTVSYVMYWLQPMVLPALGIGLVLWLRSRYKREVGKQGKERTNSGQKRK